MHTHLFYFVFFETLHACTLLALACLLILGSCILLILGLNAILHANWANCWTIHCMGSGSLAPYLMEPTTVGSLWLENDSNENENELEFEFLYGKIGKTCLHYFAWDSRISARSYISTWHRSLCLMSRGRKSMPPIWISRRREYMELIV